MTGHTLFCRAKRLHINHLRSHIRVSLPDQSKSPQNAPDESQKTIFHFCLDVLTDDLSE